MAIPFSEIPANILPPLFYAEAEPSQAPFNQSLKLVLIGMKNTQGPAVRRGTATVNVPYLLSDDKARQLFGRGSMLHAMYHYARSNAPFIQIWGVALEEMEDGDPGTMFVQIAGPAVDTIRTETITFLLAGFPVSFITKVGDTRAAVATKLAKAINAVPMIPVVASIDPVITHRVIITCLWTGLSCNDIHPEFNFPGRQNNSVTRVLDLQFANTFKWTGMTGGGLLSPCLAALSDEKFDIFCVGDQAGPAALNLLDDEFDGTSGRWSPYRQQYGHAVVAETLAFSTLYSRAEPRNGPHVTYVGTDATAPQPAWHWGPAVAARMAQHWAAPPELSRPLQTIELRGILPPFKEVHRFDIQERQQLLEAGVTTYITDTDLTVRIDRIRTMYKRNVWGDNDSSWSDAVTLFQISFFIRSMRAVIRGTFPRAALTTEETGIPGFASPGLVHDVIVHHYRELESIGLVENTALFAEALIVERNALDANRLDVLARPDVVNQLRIVAMLVQSYLELTATPANGLS